MILMSPPLLLARVCVRVCASYTQEGRYEGQTKGGVREGIGQLSWPNGDTYLGDFHNGLRHGQGTTAMS